MLRSRLLILAVVLIIAVQPITLNMNDSSSDPIVVILRQSKPSVLIMPHKEKIVINLPRKRFWSIDTSNKETTLTFGNYDKPLLSSNPHDKNITVTSQPFSLHGTYKVSGGDRWNSAHPNPIKINQTHISYKICSSNYCEYNYEGGHLSIDSCTLVENKQCKAFSDLFYQDLQFLIHLQLAKTLKVKGNTVRFYDEAGGQRL